MNESWALKAIKEGYVEVDGIKYEIVSNPTGSCLGCYFYPAKCDHVPKVTTICCSHGGNVLVLPQQN